MWWKTDPYILESLFSPKEPCVINSHFPSFLRENGTTKQKVLHWGGMKTWLRPVSVRLHWERSEQNTIKERKHISSEAWVMLIKTHYYHHDYVSLTTFLLHNMKWYRLNRK
jgi:hypothetical protein